MSILASRVRKQVTLRDPDGGPDVTVLIRKLSGLSLDKAANARQMEAMRMAGAIDPGALNAYQKTLEVAREPKPGAVEPPPDPKGRFAAYDPLEVLVAGIAGWSLMEQRDGEAEPHPVPVNRDTISDLDRASLVALFEEILTLSLPPLDAAAAEGEQKKAEGAPLPA